MAARPRPRRPDHHVRDLTPPRGVRPAPHRAARLSDRIEVREGPALETSGRWTVHCDSSSSTPTRRLSRLLRGDPATPRRPGVIGGRHTLVEWPSRRGRRGRTRTRIAMRRFNDHVVADARCVFGASSPSRDGVHPHPQMVTSARLSRPPLAHSEARRLPAARAGAAGCVLRAGRPEAGVSEIALTEHLFHLQEPAKCSGTSGSDEPDEGLRHTMGAYWDHHATADLDDYVSRCPRRQASGAPGPARPRGRLLPGRMTDVAALLALSGFDVLLGSVHWIGPGCSTFSTSRAQDGGVGPRGAPEQAWCSYTETLEELAGTRTCRCARPPGSG